jgi:four helix bundle protein
MGGENNVLAEKSFAFSIRMVNCYKFLTDSKKEFVMSKQLVRCGTSIGANIHESIYAQSASDFVSKLSISLKEASETSYWLKLLSETHYLDTKMYASLKHDIDELLRLLISSIKTSKNRPKK